MLEYDPEAIETLQRIERVVGSPEELAWLLAVAEPRVLATAWHLAARRLQSSAGVHGAHGGAMCSRRPAFMELMEGSLPSSRTDNRRSGVLAELSGGPWRGRL